MIRIVSSLTLLILMASSATAGPLPWNYTVRFAPAGNAEAILLGKETRYDYDRATGVETYTPVWIVLNSSKRSASGQAFFGTADLFTFHHGMWNLAESPPSDTIANQFVLKYDFTGGGPSGEVGGDISAMGVFTSGTGNFTLGLSGDRELVVGNQRAKLQFGIRESESQSTITMTITPELSPAPEPATLALAGIGFAGVLVTRLRRGCFADQRKRSRSR